MTHGSLNAPRDGNVPVMRINAAVAHRIVASARVAAGVRPGAWPSWRHWASCC